LDPFSSLYYRRLERGTFGEALVQLIQAPYIDNEREFILSLLREENEVDSYKNMTKGVLITTLLKKLSNCKCLVIDDSQNLLISRRSLMNHFLFMSWLVNETWRRIVTSNDGELDHREFRALTESVVSANACLFAKAGYLARRRNDVSRVA